MFIDKNDEIRTLQNDKEHFNRNEENHFYDLEKTPVNVTAEFMDIILCYTGAMLQMRRLSNHGRRLLSAELIYFQHLSFVSFSKN